MRRILCVIDLTESSLKVLRVAIGLAHASKAYLTVLYPYRLINYDFQHDGTLLKVKLEEAARKKFAILEGQITCLHLSNEFQPEIGFTADRINAYVQRHELDMIVISQHQADTINETNSIALQNLIASSKLPFTIVPES